VAPTDDVHLRLTRRAQPLNCTMGDLVINEVPIARTNYVGWEEFD
jgi:hypothetical protein